jgi:hypothetical protein
MQAWSLYGCTVNSSDNRFLHVFLFYAAAYLFSTHGVKVPLFLDHFAVVVFKNSWIARLAER